jgi:SAM-dependent methyltransferase
MNRTDVIQAFIDGRGLASYLEIGLGSGHNFLRVRAARKIGVDPSPRIGSLKRLRWWLRNASNRASRIRRMSSEQFFAGRGALFGASGLDIAFVDGLHTYGQTLRDIERCLAHLRPGGVVLVHDCSPPSAAAATPARSPEEARRRAGSVWDGAWCGDVYKAILHLRSESSDLRVCVLDCDRGVGVVEPGEPFGRLGLGRDEIERLGYAELASHREEWLDLRPVTSLAELVGARRVA